jgi:hypothetical protein
MISGIHIYQGKCPDQINGPYSRDPNCPVCVALMVYESGKNDNQNDHPMRIEKRAIEF